MTITMDGKAPLYLPHLARMPKSLLTKFRPKLQLYGIINSGVKAYEYIPYFDWWSRDANLAMSFVYLHLRRYFEENGTKKPIMYLQTDNCARDNKNRWILGLLGLFVHFGYFDRIEVHMLPPGHSHERVNLPVRSGPNSLFSG